MNTKHLLAASLVGGLISLVLVNAPYFSLINLLICAGFWVGPIAAVWLYKRLTGSLTINQALVIGTLVGVCHGLFGLLLSPLGFAGAGGLLNELRPFMSAQDLPDLENSLAGVGGLMFNLVGVSVDIVFGFLGGLIGGTIFRSDRSARKTNLEESRLSVDASK
jgi:hypothetical protein